MDNATRAFVTDRASRRCEYCLVRDEDDELTFHVEHIVSQKHGGESMEANLAYSCQNCNLHKGTNLAGIDPESGELTSLYHPREDAWSDHFQYAGARILGLTAKGRTTVRVLNMNDPDRIQLRSILGYPYDA